MVRLACSRFLIGIISMVLLLMNLIMLPIILFLCVVIKKLIPGKFFVTKQLERLIQVTLPAVWTGINNRVLACNPRIQWEITGAGLLSEDNWYVLISNHISAIDILVLQKVFHRHIPHLKFLMKRELLWQLPFAGLACWCMGYPFVRRITKQIAKRKPGLKGQDIRDIEQACRSARWPTAFVSFLEGTRFSRRKQQAHSADFTHVLPPHIASFCVMQNSLSDKKPCLIDVTLHYAVEAGHAVSLKNFLFGRVRTIYVHYNVTPFCQAHVGQFDKDRVLRKTIRQYLFALWQEKDQWIKNKCRDRGQG